MACSGSDKKPVEGGFELKMVEEDKDLECSICLLLLKDAMGTPCSHVFCCGCIQKLIGKEKIEGMTFKCPDCQQPVNADKQHKSECNYKVVQCIYEGCLFSAIKLKIKDHESICEYRTVQCEHCKADLKAKSLKDHYICCEWIPTLCPQIDCDVLIPNIEMQKHINEDCLFVYVSCSYEKFGCPAKFLRKDLDRHNDESMKQHMALMRDQLSQVQSQIQDLKVENEAMQNENTQLKAVNTNLQNDIKELKEQYLILNKSFSSYELSFLLQNGVEKWIKRNGNIFLEESYKEWFDKMFNAMVKKKLYKLNSAMVVKLQNVGRKEIYWSSNGEEEHERIFNLGSVYYRGNDGFVLRDGENQSIIETKTLHHFKCSNSIAVVLHPMDERNMAYFNGDLLSFKLKYNGWKIGLSSEEFYVNDHVVCFSYV